MEELMKLMMDRKGKNPLSIEEIAKELYKIYSEALSVVDKWYVAGDEFWLRRTTASDYLSVQVFPLLDKSFLCYLHSLHIDDYDKKSVERYSCNVKEIPDGLPDDMKYIYPIAISQDIDKASEMFLASSIELKNEWLNKFGIRKDTK